MALALLGFADIITIQGYRGLEQCFAKMRIAGSLALLAIIAGGKGWEDMENYGISKQTRLKQFLELPNGIPHHDTFRRVFEKLDPKILKQKLTQWVQKVLGSVVDQVIPIDGKSLRVSYDRNQGKKKFTFSDSVGF